MHGLTIPRDKAPSSRPLQQEILIITMRHRQPTLYSATERKKATILTTQGSLLQATHAIPLVAPDGFRSWPDPLQHLQRSRLASHSDMVRQRRDMREPILQEDFHAPDVACEGRRAYDARLQAWDGPFFEDGLDAGGHDTPAVICGSDVV